MVSIAKLVGNFGFEIQRANSAGSAEANSVKTGYVVVIKIEDVFPELQDRVVCRVVEAASIAQPHPVSINGDILETLVAGIHAVEGRVAVLFANAAFGKDRRKRVDTENVGRVGQAKPVKGEALEERSMSFTPTNHSLPKLSS